MSRAGQLLGTSRALLRTWGVRGAARRARHELRRRVGTERQESAWTSLIEGPVDPLAELGTTPLAIGRTEAGPSPTALLYGAFEVEVGSSPDWHTHPLTGHRFDPGAHWSRLGDSDAAHGDIKDVWELSRLGWLQPSLRAWAGSGDEAIAEHIWQTIEHWCEHNPPYRGPNWMCGQETSLRAITVILLADGLRSSETTTDARRELVARLVANSVGRVEETLGYALSQRNNHAISEAGMLWTASLLAPSLPGSGARRDRAARALVETCRDQFGEDGSHSQHSPTYHRLALQVLLFVLAVGRALGEPPPPGVEAAVGASARYLSALVVPGSGGRAPNLGGNDGALLLSLTDRPIGDFRPTLVHAATAVGAPSPIEPGTWDAEARWFGLQPRAGRAVVPPRTIATHPLGTGSRARAVLRAGPLRHRPAHADQLHVDVWLGGVPVAVDAGSYRYTAPAPWGNALADEEAHNVPLALPARQAMRRGRFLWIRWEEASVRLVRHSDGVALALASLTIPGAGTVHRLVLCGDGWAGVVDETPPGRWRIRWNLLDARSLDPGDGETHAEGATWSASFLHPGPAVRPERDPTNPASGWHAPTYAVLDPLDALILPAGGRPACSLFRLDGATAPDLEDLARLSPSAPPDLVDDQVARLGVRAHHREPNTPS